MTPEGAGVPEKIDEKIERTAVPDEDWAIRGCREA